MTRSPSLLPLIALAALAAFVWWHRPHRPAPGPVPTGPDLVAAFRTNDDRPQAAQHARIFGTICGSLAEYLEYDGTRPDPLLRTGVQIDDFRRHVRQVRMKGWSFSTQYPELGPAVDRFLTQELGTRGGAFAAEQRAKWVAALRQLEACALYASEQG